MASVVLRCTDDQDGAQLLESNRAARARDQMFAFEHCLQNSFRPGTALLSSVLNQHNSSAAMLCMQHTC